MCMSYSLAWIAYARKRWRRERKYRPCCDSIFNVKAGNFTFFPLGRVQFNETVVCLATLWLIQFRCCDDLVVFRSSLAGWMWMSCGLANCRPPRVKSRLDVSSLMNVDGFFLSFVQLHVVWRNVVCESENADIRSRAQVSRKNTEKKNSPHSRALLRFKHTFFFTSISIHMLPLALCWELPTQHRKHRTHIFHKSRGAEREKKRDESVGKASDNKLIFNFSFSATVQATASRRQHVSHGRCCCLNKISVHAHTNREEERECVTTEKTNWPSSMSLLLPLFSCSLFSILASSDRSFKPK